VLVGGDGPDRAATSDVWEWDGRAWLRIPTGGAGPGARTRHRLAFDPIRGTTLLFGGQIGSGPSAVFPNDTWAWDGQAWTRLATDGPPARYLHAMAFDRRRERVVMSGGGLGAPPWRALGDTWEWDGQRWLEVR
jgi:hypothetical protein